MQIASFSPLPFFFLLASLQGLEMFSFKPCMLSSGVWGKLTFWWLLCMLEMLVRMQGLVADVPLCCCCKIKYWCGNLLTSFGEPSTKIVGIFSVCFPKLLFHPDEAQVHIGWGWSFTFSAWVYRRSFYSSVINGISAEILMVWGFFYVWKLSLLLLLLLGFSQLFFSVFQDVFLSWNLPWKNKISIGLDLSVGYLSAVVARDVLKAIVLILMPRGL